MYFMIVTAWRWNNDQMYVLIKLVQILVGKIEIDICHNNQAIVITNLVLHFQLTQFFSHYQYLSYLT